MREIVVAEREVVEGEGVPQWIPVGPSFRASVLPVRTAEAEKQGSVRVQNAYSFRCWTAALRELGLQETHRLVWSGRVWNIREIRWPMGSEQMTDVVAEVGVTL